MRNIILIIKFLLTITAFLLFVGVALVVSIGRAAVIVTAVLLERRRPQLASVQALPQRSGGSAARAERIEIATVAA